VPLRSGAVRAAFFALLAYFLLALILTYPLLLHFTTHVAGDGSDDPALAWNLWWVRYALLDLRTSPIYTDYMFFPIGLNLGFYTLTYLNAFLSIPFQFTLGLIPAANINLWLSFTLSGFGAYLLVKYLLRRDLSLRGTAAAAFAEPVPQQSPSRGIITAGDEIAAVRQVPHHLAMTIVTPAAFAAGLVYAFSANKFLYASLGQFNIASSQWIPFYILFLLKIFDTPNAPLRYGFLLGLFLLAQALSEFIFASFLVLFTITYLIYWLIPIRFQITNHKLVPSRVEGSQIINLLLAALVFLLPMSPILAAMLSDTLTEGDFIQQGLGFSNSFSADLLGFFIPSHLHPLLGNLESQFSFSYINFMYLGFGALVLAVLALIKLKPARIWGVWFVLIALITLGPTLRINGAEFDLPLPFDLLLQIPLIKGNRYPSRWSVMLVLCLAVLVGYGVAWLLERVGRRQEAESSEPRLGRRPSSVVRRLLLPPAFFAATAICLLLTFESLSIPLPLSDFRVPDIYQQMASDTGNGTVLEIPLAWRNGFRVTGSYRRDSQVLPDRIFMFAQWYQTTQQHPILNGNTSRNPELKFQYFTETPVLASLIAIQTGHDVDEATRARDKELAPRILQFFGTRYVIWHTPFSDENRDVADKTRAYLEQVFPITKISESYENGRGVVAYHVNSIAPNDAITLKPQAPLARLYLGEGWSALGGDAFWAQRQAAKLFVPHTAGDIKLTLKQFTPYPTQGQGLTVRVNGKDIGHYNPIPISDGAFSVVLPASTLNDGMNEITLGFDQLAPIADIKMNPQLPNEKVSIVVRSAGEEQGAFGHIYVNGVDESPNQRGYNVVVIEPRTGQIIDRANFDTFASGREATRMQEFIANVAEGDLVAVAASDEASTHLTQGAVDALKSIGANVDLRGKFRWSHALIGVKGAFPGSALEEASETNVAQVYLNAPLTEPNVAARIGEIDVEPVP